MEFFLNFFSIFSQFEERTLVEKKLTENSLLDFYCRSLYCSIDFFRSCWFKRLKRVLVGRQTDRMTERKTDIHLDKEIDICTQTDMKTDRQKDTKYGGLTKTW